MEAMTWWQQLFGDNSSRYLKGLKPLVDKINQLEELLKNLTAEELRAKTAQFKERLTAGETLDDLLPEAFAAVREASRRTLGQRHYDVQLLGGIALHQGKISEMRTGEGKTLVATLPTYLNALAGKGVHIITVNDYLARRDAVWMGQIYHALGLTIGVINHESSFFYSADEKAEAKDTERDTEGSFRVFYEFLKPCSRREAYQADITYGTNNEFGFDYLRDNLAQQPEQVVQLSWPNRTKHHYAVIDEVDSILIDEARTPLIISAPVGESESLYGTFSRISQQLEVERDYTIDEKTKSISLTEEGISRAEELLGVKDIYTERGIKYVHHLETAVRAKALFERDRHYVVRDGEIMIVDEFTGRLQPGRRWSDGLHQAIEAKEGVRVKEETRTYASITFQNYFKLYEKIAGMTGTALTSEEEFLRVYGKETVAIPPHRPNARRDLNDLIFQTDAGKLKAIVRKIKELHVAGQPVLVGTISIEKNERLSAYLKTEGIPHRLLNAKNNEEEGAVIAGAGQRGSVVIATNMAGRGVDIKLGGAEATKEEGDEVRRLGGLFVLGTERHEARRIDNQLRGRSGRQGDPGATQFFISLEDDLARVFAPEKIKNMMKRFGLPEDEAIENGLVSRAIEGAQEKIEGLNFDLRKHLLDYDNVLNYQRMIIYGRRQELLFGGRVAAETAVNQLLERAPDLAAEVGAKKKQLGEETFYQTVRGALLQIIDLHWIEHLEMMEYMKSSIRLRAYGQRDPLVEYKKEGLALFKEMERHIDEQWAGFITNLGAAPSGVRVTAGAVVGNNGGNSANNNAANPLTIKVSPAAQAASRAAAEIVRTAQGQTVGANSDQKVGRNDPCPCGSGKKYKKCHGK